jgi:hypothetical protein
MDVGMGRRGCALSLAAVRIHEGALAPEISSTLPRGDRRDGHDRARPDLNGNVDMFDKRYSLNARRDPLSRCPQSVSKSISTASAMAMGMTSGFPALQRGDLPAVMGCD